jgi:Zn ribbon nucleic-acid-binding protein
VVTGVVLKDKMSRAPSVCPKCNYQGKYMMPHEDGWQCWNCMKIIYEKLPSIEDVEDVIDNTEDVMEEDIEAVVDFAQEYV